MQAPAHENISKEKLLEIVQKLLRSDLDLTFLMKLEQREMEQLVAAIRESRRKPVKWRLILWHQGSDLQPSIFLHVADGRRSEPVIIVVCVP